MKCKHDKDEKYIKQSDNPHRVEPGFSQVYWDGKQREAQMSKWGL